MNRPEKHKDRRPNAVHWRSLSGPWLLLDITFILKNGNYFKSWRLDVVVGSLLKGVQAWRRDSRGSRNGTEPAHLFFRAQRIWTFALSVTPKRNYLHAASVSTIAWWLGEGTNVMFSWFVIRNKTRGNYLFHLVIQLSTTHPTLLRNLLLLLPTAVLSRAIWPSTLSDFWWPGVGGCREKFEF